MSQAVKYRSAAIVVDLTLRGIFSSSLQILYLTFPLQIPTSLVNPLFRNASPSDIPALVKLVESAYRGDASRAGWTTEADLLDGRRTGVDEIADLITRENSLILLAEQDNEIIACAHIQRHEIYAYFGMFSVQPTLQGRGLGHDLLAEAERLVRNSWGCSEMRMRVISIRTELIAWYERRGYRRTGQFAPFPYGDPRFGIPKRDNLCFEVLVKTFRFGG